VRLIKGLYCHMDILKDKLPQSTVKRGEEYLHCVKIVNWRGYRFCAQVISKASNECVIFQRNVASPNSTVEIFKWTSKIMEIDPVLDEYGKPGCADDVATMRVNSAKIDLSEGRINSTVWHNLPNSNQLDQSKETGISFGVK